MTTQNGYKMSIQNETSNVHFVYTKLTSKCTKFSCYVHTFDILVYKMGTKFGQKLQCHRKYGYKMTTQNGFKMTIQNGTILYTKWV